MGKKCVGCFKENGCAGDYFPNCTKKPIFITETANEGITEKSKRFFQDHRKYLGYIVKVRGYKDDELDYWVEFSDAAENVIRVSGFSWGYSGEGPYGLAWACESVGLPLDIRKIASIPTDDCWEVENN